MTEVYKDIPPWFWLLLAVSGFAILTFLLGLLRWGLMRFIKNNDESWKTMNDNVSTMTKGINELVKVTTVHEHRLTSMERRME